MCSSTRRSVRGAAPLPLICELISEPASAETPVVTCGSLFQVTPDGEKGEAIPLADCAPSAGADSACAVRDPANRVWFAPEPGGRDPGGPDGAAYATLAFVVVDVGPDVTDADRRSETAVAPIERVSSVSEGEEGDSAEAPEAAPVVRASSVCVCVYVRACVVRVVRLAGRP